MVNARMVNPYADTSLEVFWEVREYVEAMQIHASDASDDEGVRQLAVIWCLLNDSCNAIHGKDM
jgi:hypothetical protein